MQQATIRVEGMTCGGCVNSVTMAIKAVAGVASAEVSLANKEAKVLFDESRTSAEKIAAAVNETGYKAAV